MSIESCGAIWRAANGETADFRTPMSCPSVDLSRMNDLAISLKKDARLIEDVGFIDPHLAKKSGLQHGGLTALLRFVLRTPVETVKSGF